MSKNIAFSLGVLALGFGLVSSPGYTTALANSYGGTPWGAESCEQAASLASEAIDAKGNLAVVAETQSDLASGMIGGRYPSASIGTRHPTMAMTNHRNKLITIRRCPRDNAEDPTSDCNNGVRRRAMAASPVSNPAGDDPNNVRFPPVSIYNGLAGDDP